MKTIILIITVLLMASSCSGKTNFSSEEIEKIKQDLQLALINIAESDTMLKDIQHKILIAFISGQIKQDDKDLLAIENSLMKLIAKSKNNIVVYWYSFACYYHSIFYSIKKDKKNSEKILIEGINQIEKIGTKNSEHYALLAMMQSFSIQFAPGIRAPFISKNVKLNAEKALAIDSLNLRAYYVLGSNDYYTPEQYGGGKKAENYLKKALSLKDQSQVNPYLPSWGRNSSYELLIKFYMAHNRFDEAKKYYKEANALFPDDYMINQLAAKLVNH